MKRVKFVKYLGLGISSALLIALVYLASSTLTIASGVSRVVQRPRHLVRLQIINGSNVTGLAREVARSLSDCSDSALQLLVVDTVEFDLEIVARSLVVSRQEAKAPAILLAEKLGLDPSEVVFRPLEHNRRQVSATLIVGADYQSMRLPEVKCKEN